MAHIAAETRVAADRLFPDAASPADGRLSPPSTSADWVPITAAESGHIQLVDEEALVAFAAKRDLVVETERGIGEFIVAETPLVSISGEPARRADAAEAVRAVFTISRTRTIEQDVMFGVRQIVDVALRALSPSLNDPTTATLCVDQLTTILYQLSGRRMGARRHFVNGKLRLVACQPDFADVLTLAYGEIRANAASQVLVLRKILYGLRLLAEVINDPPRRRPLAAEAHALNELLRRDTCDPATRAICEDADRLIAQLAEPKAGDSQA